MKSQYIYLTEQIRELERQAIEQFGISGDTLMARAGAAAFDFMRNHWPRIQHVAVLCGGGNNGGDGYVLAQHAHQHGLQVEIYQVGDHGQLQGEALRAMQVCKSAGITMLPVDDFANTTKPELIVDAICGIGLQTSLRKDVLQLIEYVQSLELPIYALDIPTGVNADCGAIYGGELRATATMTFIGYKLGLMTGAGASCTGHLTLNDLQLPSEAFASAKPVAERLTLSHFSDYLKPRPRDWHKGLSGHVLVIGGDVGYSGAPHMAAEAALRVGAGLVTVATHPDNAASMNTGCPEIMARGVNNAEQLIPLLEKANVIVFGPGLGMTQWGKSLWQFVIEQALPKVVDADALNLLAENQMQRDDWVLTPHPGEAARLLGEVTSVLQQDRLAAVNNLQQRFGGVAVLKGVGSLILAPEGLPGLCDKGNPGMSSAGMGDILSGVIGGLIAQKVPLGDAAKLGVCLHALAGDMAAEAGQRGTIATDLLPHLRVLCNL